MISDTQNCLIWQFDVAWKLADIHLTGLPRKNACGVLRQVCIRLPTDGGWRTSANMISRAFTRSSYDPLTRAESRARMSRLWSAKRLCSGTHGHVRHSVLVYFHDDRPGRHCGGAGATARRSLPLSALRGGCCRALIPAKKQGALHRRRNPLTVTLHPSSWPSSPVRIADLRTPRPCQRMRVCTSTNARAAANCCGRSPATAVSFALLAR